jgi:hypothetical protein
VMEIDGERTGDRKKSGSGAREPAGHRLRPCYFLFPGPAGGEKTKLGGELLREEQLISRTGRCKDRVGTFDDLSEGVFRMSSPPPAPARPESHMSRGHAGPTRPAPIDQPS